MYVCMYVWQIWFSMAIIPRNIPFERNGNACVYIQFCLIWSAVCWGWLGTLLHVPTGSSMCATCCQGYQVTVPPLPAPCITHIPLGSCLWTGCMPVTENKCIIMVLTLEWATNWLIKLLCLFVLRCMGRVLLVYWLLLRCVTYWLYWISPDIYMQGMMFGG